MPLPSVHLPTVPQIKWFLRRTLLVYLTALVLCLLMQLGESPEPDSGDYTIEIHHNSGPLTFSATLTMPSNTLLRILVSSLVLMTSYFFGLVFQAITTPVLVVLKVAKVMALWAPAFFVYQSSVVGFYVKVGRVIARTWMLGPRWILRRRYGGAVVDELGFEQVADLVLWPPERGSLVKVERVEVVVREG